MRALRGWGGKSPLGGGIRDRLNIASNFSITRLEIPLSKIFLIRHGQSTFNEHYEATGRDPGHFDARLTMRGRQQAKEAADHMEREAIDLVITSPLSRAIETGLTIFGHRALPFYVTCRHRERLESSGDVGRPPHELKKDFPQLDFDHLSDPWWHHDHHSKASFAVEPYEGFQKRVADFRHWLNDHKGQRIAVIGHATFFHALTGQWLNNCQILDWSAMS